MCGCVFLSFFSFSSLPASICSRCLGCSVSHPLVCLTAKNDWSRKVQSLARSKHTSRLKGWSTVSEWVSESERECERKGIGGGGGGGEAEDDNSRERGANVQLLAETGRLGNPPHTLPELPLSRSNDVSSRGCLWIYLQWLQYSLESFSNSLALLFMISVFQSFRTEGQSANLRGGPEYKFKRSERTEKHREKY